MALWKGDLRRPNKPPRAPTVAATRTCLASCSPINRRDVYEQVSQGWREWSVQGAAAGREGNPGLYLTGHRLMSTKEIRHASPASAQIDLNKPLAVRVRRLLALVFDYGS